MVCSVAVTYFGRCTGTVFGCLAKQAFIVRNLEEVHTTLQRSVAVVAKRYFGEWFGEAIAVQAGNDMAMPMASFLGDIIWLCVSRIVEAATMTSADLMGLARCRQEWPGMVLTAIRVMCISVGYYAKYLFCRSAIPAINAALRSLFSACLPLMVNGRLGRCVLSPAVLSGVTVFSPPIAIVFGDIVGLSIQLLLYQLARAVYLAIQGRPTQGS